MNKLISTACLCAFAAVLTTGCATNRSEVQLALPPQASAPAAAKGINVVIRTVADDRRFEAAPSDPSIPSLGFEGSENASKELKAKAIARKRNGFGKALGDVVLQDGQTVAGVIRTSLASAFEQAGYKVLNEVPASGAAVVVDVSVKKFWAWMTPGFWALTFESTIATDVSVQGKGKSVRIEAYGNDSRQLGTDSAWIEIVNKGLGDYRSKAIEAAPKLLE